MKKPQVYKDLVEMKDHFDLSNLEPTNPYHEPGFTANKAVVGKMKAEVAANPIGEFVGLRPKMYSFDEVKINPDGTTERYDKDPAKGIQRAAAERFLHEKYLAQLPNPTENYALNRRLGCRHQQIYGIEVLHPSQNFAIHDLFLNMSAPFPTCHDRFLSMSSSVP